MPVAPGRINLAEDTAGDDLPPSDHLPPGDARERLLATGPDAAVEPDGEPLTEVAPEPRDATEPDDGSHAQTASEFHAVLETDAAPERDGAGNRRAPETDAAPQPAGPTTAADEGLAELRRLLLGPDRLDVADLRRRLDDPAVRAAELSPLLADAIRLRDHPDPRLIDALTPPFEAAFKTSVQRDPQQLVDAISPVMGPAIRKAISDALQRMVQSLSTAMEHSVSPRGLGWRLEAVRTGKPFAEVVMLHTLLYRVEQVFLIHRTTGLLLQHLTAAARGRRTGTWCRACSRPSRTSSATRSARPRAIRWTTCGWGS